MPTARNALPNLHTLALFVAVVEEGSLSAAARKLGAHQPNASRSIAQLEREIGVPLLQRSTSGATPTDAGREYAKRAKHLVAAAEQFATWAGALASGTPTTVRVGASMTVSEFLLPFWLTALATIDSRIRVETHVGNSAWVMDQVKSGALDVGLVETLRLPEWGHSGRIGTDELVAVIAPHHPWAERRDRLSLSELASTPLASREAGSGTREALADLVAQHLPGVTLAEPAHVLSSNSAVRIAVATGAAPAVLSELAVQAQLDSGQLLKVPLERPLIRPLTAIWRGRLSDPARALVNVATP